MSISKESMKEKLTAAFREAFGKEPAGFAEAPGRVELIGNHTDHQGGQVLAASVDLRAYAAFAPNGTDMVNIISEGHSGAKINVKELMPDVSEFNSEPAIVRGVLRGFYDFAGQAEKEAGCTDSEGEAEKAGCTHSEGEAEKAGCTHSEGEAEKAGCTHPEGETARGPRTKDVSLSGFDAYIVSEVLTGSGLSSSAAYEVLLGRIINELFFENKVSALQIAKIGQFAENKFFGKPSGLMDQAASSVGDVVFFDFKDPKEPSVTRIPFDFQEAGYALCAVACGGGHADLTDEYAAIPGDMCAVARLFGKEVLKDVKEAEVRAEKEEIIAKLGERPYLRALHFFEESRRAEEAASALLEKDMPRFLALANQSGISSRTKLANIIPASNPSENKLDLAMRIAVDALGGKKLDGSEGSGMKGAVRMNGGGFSGTFLSIVPLEILDNFKTTVEAKLGKGSCIQLNT